MDGFSGTGGDAAQSRRFRLREATADAHRRVEAAAGAGGGPEGVFACRSGYRAYLEAMHAVRREIEDLLDLSGAEDLFSRWPARRIAADLARDLRDLGGVPAAERKSRGWPNRLKWPEILGVLYVIEGSALGARLLARSAGEAGYGPAFGARHLHAQTADPAAWRAFVEVLEGAALDHDGEAACTHAAVRTFDLFARSFAAGAEAAR